MRDAAAFGQSWVNMAKEIGDILKGETVEEPEAKAEPEKVSPQQFGAVADTPEKSEAPEETVEADTPASEPEEQPKPEKTPSRELGGLKAAVTAERNKRQAVENEAKALRDEIARERAEFRNQMAQLMSQFAPKPPETPQPTVFDDPQAWEQRQTQGFESKLRHADIKWSQRIAIRHYGRDKFAAAETALEEHVRNNPNDAIIHALRNSDDPAEEMMQWYEQRSKLNDFSDPEAAIERLLSESPELKAKLLSKLGVQPTAEKPQTPAPSALPSNLAGARSVSGNRGQVFSGAKPLEEILGSRKR